MIYELKPTNGRKSFYGKAMVEVSEGGTQTLYSYGTPVVERRTHGSLRRLWGGWTSATGAHVKSFCGLNKRQFMELEFEG